MRPDKYVVFPDPPAEPVSACALDDSGEVIETFRFGDDGRPVWDNAYRVHDHDVCEAVMHALGRVDA